MLFNSHVFLFLYFPFVVSICYFVSRPTSSATIKCFIIFASFIFYAWWNINFLPLLVGSILVNWSLSSVISNKRTKPFWQTSVLFFGIASNLGVLGYFKYADFFLSTTNAIANTSFQITANELPLAISFFTFQQIAFLVDGYRRETSDNEFCDYAFFISFFPQLIAGPIVLQREIFPQISRHWKPVASPEYIAIGLVLLSIGLAKKVLIADTLGEYADVFFAAIESGAPALFFSSWLGSILFSLQIYFDFSGYSDIAVGLALILNIRLPINFNSPYKATSIIEFWRRWHMTLSRFLREYLYIPLGGNRCGAVRWSMNIMLVMILGGLWHGAGWAFLCWGGIHGAMIVLNHGWRTICSRALIGMPSSLVIRFLYWALTATVVIAAWVPFRTADLSQSILVWRAMFGFNGISISPLIIGLIGDHAEWFEFFNIRFDGFFGSIWTYPIEVILLGSSLLLGCLFLPNSNELAGYTDVQPNNHKGSVRRLPQRAYVAAAAGGLLGISTLKFWSPDVYIYFQF